MTADVSIGVPGALGPEAVRRLAPRVEAAGFAGIWLNDSPEGDFLAGLAAAAEVTTPPPTRQRRDPRRPACRTRDHRGPPPHGGAGGAAHARHRVRTAEDGCRRRGRRGGHRAPAGVEGGGGRRRARAPDAAARAEHADGVLLSWLTPAVAAEQAEELRALGRDAQGEMPRIALYARTIVDEAARPVLEREAAQYGTYPAYAANFARLGIGPIDTTLAPEDVGLAAGVAPYRAADRRARAAGHHAHGLAR